MGDRCTCTLHIAGLLLKEHIPHLATALLRAHVSEFTKSSDIEEFLLRGETSFTFYEVNYAQLDTGLEEALDGLCLSYSWENGIGDEYGAGAVLCDARTGVCAEYNLVNGNIVLSLDEAEREGGTAYARQWEQFRSKLKLFIPKNHHEELAARAGGDGFDGYAALQHKIALPQAA